MKKIIPLALILSALLLAACNSSTESPTADSTEAPVTAQAPGTPDVEVAQEYPLDTCVISGQKLDSMGGPYVHDHNGTEVQFCCDGCIPRFNEDPEKHLAKIAAARNNSED